jgi:predicted ribosome quality control (RQC) complex YloA/Tae2 family protein
MLLRKRFGGLRLVALSTITAGERVVALDFGAQHDRLIAELTGPHANVFVVDPEGTIVASLRPASSATRPLSPGVPYAPPPAAPPTASWRGRDRFGSQDGVSARIAAHYDDQLRAAEEALLREQAGVQLRRAIDRLERREAALRGDLARVDEAASFRKLGDLILAHLHEIGGRGKSSITLPDDFEDGAPLTIPLDPALDARENAARFYKQHTRLTAGRRRVVARLTDTTNALTEARARLASLASLPIASLRELVPAARAVSRAAAARPAPRLPYRTFTSLAGDEILAGRTAADNDTLTFRVARGSDLWLHTRDAPGSHVIVRSRGGEVAEQTLLDAATLAAHYSPLSGEAQVDVSVTRVKNLRKPKHAAPGLVFVSDAKTLRVRMEPTRLARLLGRDED